MNERTSYAPLITLISNSLEARAESLQTRADMFQQSGDYYRSFHALGLSHAYGHMAYHMLELLGSIPSEATAEEVLNAIHEIVSKL